MANHAKIIIIDDNPDYVFSAVRPLSKVWLGSLFPQVQRNYLLLFHTIGLTLSPFFC